MAGAPDKPLTHPQLQKSPSITRLNPRIPRLMFDWLISIEMLIRELEMSWRTYVIAIHVSEGPNRTRRKSLGELGFYLRNY